MSKPPMDGREQIVNAVKSTLKLSTKKEAEAITLAVLGEVFNIIKSHIDESGYSLRVPELGKLTVKHIPGKLRKNPFKEGELTQTLTKRKVKFVSLGALRELEVVK
jgi:nucleoid DNA-binding protein